MKKNETENSSKKDKTSDKILNKTADTINWWNKMATINKDDSFVTGFFKVVLRVVGILLMIAISPLVLLGLFVAFTAAF